jgi:hypothetical protein
MTAKTEQLISPNEDIEKPLTNPTRKKAYRFTHLLMSTPRSVVGTPPAWKITESAPTNSSYDPHKN